MARGAGAARGAGGAGGAVVVGGGPAGLAAALALAHRGFRVAVAERRAAGSPGARNQGYVFGLDRRGQAALGPGVLGPEASRAVRSGIARRSASFRDGAPLLIAAADGSVDERALPFKTGNEIQFIRRHELVEALAEAVEAEPQVELITGDEASVEVAAGAEGERIEVRVGGRTLHPDFLVGADGIGSAVRGALGEWSTLAEGRPDFGTEARTSPSTGLRYKVLNIPAGLRFGGMEAPNDRWLSVKGTRKGASALRLGLVPTHLDAQTRTANIITRDGHEFWEAVHDAESFYAYFGELFPQIPWREKVSAAEAEEFGQSRGGRFPPCQRALALGVGLEGGQAGAVLVGDAAHAFPPDIAQGVNAGLEDVAVLAEVMDHGGSGLPDAPASSSSAATTAEVFAKKRGPDVEALVKLARFSYPWQYAQSRLGQGLWAMNFALRSLLHRFIPGLFADHSFMLIQSGYALPYREIWRRAHRTTAVLAAAAFAAVAAAARACLI